MQNKRKAARSVYLGTDYVINENAEIVSELKKYRKVNEKEKLIYATMYLDDGNKYEALKGLGNFGAVWGYVLTYYSKQTAMFTFLASVKDDMRHKTGLSIGTIRSAISSFCESGLLLKVRNAEYMVNPHYFYAGLWDERTKMIELYNEKLEEVQLREQQERINAKTVTP